MTDVATAQVYVSKHCLTVETDILEVFLCSSVPVLPCRESVIDAVLENETVVIGLPGAL